MCAVRDGTGYVAATDDNEAISRRCGLENGVKAVSPWETSSERSAARWVLPGLSANMCQASRGEACDDDVLVRGLDVIEGLLEASLSVVDPRGKCWWWFCRYHLSVMQR